MTEANIMERSGQCLCGAVKITASEASTQVGACHCKICRRWAGGPMMEINCGPNVQITGEDHITIYPSSEWAERAFCGTCGSNLFYRLKGTGEHMVCIGLFNNDDRLTFTSQVFIDEKPHYYSFAEETENMTGEELFAMVSAEPDGSD